ncbi:MAG: hypothetical protein JO130_05435 [Solirubrobacterales bacterium]|nr:hypothetical protein [Solirubrobacterales bacterium]
MTDQPIPDHIPRRRCYEPGGRPVRLSVTLTQQERDQLGALAAQHRVSIATLLVDSALRSPVAPDRPDHR